MVRLKWQINIDFIGTLTMFELFSHKKTAGGYMDKPLKKEKRFWLLKLTVIRAASDARQKQTSKVLESSETLTPTRKR